MPIPIPSPDADTSFPLAGGKVDHAGIRVPDFDAAVAWFTEKLGFRLIRSLPLGDLTYGFLSHSADSSFSFELVAGPGADELRSGEDFRASYGLSGWHHVGFRVQSVDETVDELRRRGVTIVSEPHDVTPMGLRLAFFADPWGNLFELTQPLGQSH